MSSDVPQGMVMGRILFLIFINDLLDYICHSTLRLFADDCLLYKTIQSFQDAIALQQDSDLCACHADIRKYMANAVNICIL